MQFLDDLSLFHYGGKEIPCIVEKGAPTHQIEGAIGVLYMDSDSGSLYKCVAADSLTKTYNWVIVGAGDPEEIRLAVEAYFKQNPISTAGLTATEKNLMLTLFKAVPYTSDVSATMKSMEAIWNSGSSGGDTPDIPDVTNYTVTYNLTSVTAESTPASVIEGGSLTVNLTPDTNAVLGEVVVMMGGVDVTASAYSNGKISISSVTGDVVITATATVANYTQVEYLEPVGNAYIDTGYALASNDTIECVMATTGTGWKYPFGTGQVYLRTYGAYSKGTASYTRRTDGSFVNMTPANEAFLWQNNTVYTLTETEVGTIVVYDADGNEVSTLTDPNASGFTANGKRVFLFAFNEGDAPRPNTYSAATRIYAFKVKNVYGNTVCDIIPVLDADNVACMYDKISGEYLYNPNAADECYFTAGGAV